MSFIHPFSRFGLAYLLSAEQINSISEVTKEMLLKHLKIGLGHFRMKTDNKPDIDDVLNYNYVTYQEMVDNNINSIAKSANGYFLCPNILTTDYNNNSTWSSFLKLISKLETIENDKIFSERDSLTTGLVPISGKFNNGGKSQSYPKATFLEIACCAIAASTSNKPCLSYKKIKDSITSYTPTTIIPDLEIDKMIDFIELFNKIRLTQLDENILSAKVYRKKDSLNNSKKKKVEITYNRPKIFNGNFPDAPGSFAMGCAGLLGSIGKWAKEANETKWAGEVLDTLKEVPLYLIKYGDATAVTFNHYIIDLAKENKLNQIVNALYYSEIVFDGKRPYDFQEEAKTKYPLYDMFSSRFLQLFNKPTFKDFLSIRTEYKSELTELLTIYFEKIMNIRPEIVNSAKELGLWLNYVAYKAAKEETNNKDDFKKAKAKHLVEIESSALSAKRPTALLAQTITRAGRLSGMDAPAESNEFMQATGNGEISLDEAKDLITAFSRLRNKWENETDNNNSSSIEISTDISEDEQV